ncbi:hypothetical protein ACSFA3_17965 [Variovorax sp. RHLX14]|uniref:hypothetical protein n=1 Tax=Variovorax sp. RHLX14 TaxID=1259731 RepID=UPI003F45F758
MSDATIKRSDSIARFADGQNRANVQALPTKPGPFVRTATGSEVNADQVGRRAYKATVEFFSRLDPRANRLPGRGEQNDWAKSQEANNWATGYNIMSPSGFMDPILQEFVPTINPNAGRQTGTPSSAHVRSRQIGGANPQNSAQNILPQMQENSNARVTYF